MRLVVDHEHRGEAACADAGHRLKRELEVGGCDLALFEAELFADGVENALRSANMAGRTLT